MAKPTGSICNLDCTYCFYLEKENYFPASHKHEMDERTLENYVRQYIESQDVAEIHFAWQGGEPALRGLDFYRRAVELQKKYANGKEIHNGFQTNGTLIDEKWAAFFAQNDFLIGISIDGPAKFHDYYRLSKGKQPTYERVRSGLEYLKAAGVRFNTLTVINRTNGDHPLEIYRHMKEIGSEFMQFIPVVERNPDKRAKRDHLDFAGPPSLDEFPEDDSPVTDFSVQPLQFGTFMTAIFDEWIRHDVGQIFVNYFDNTLASWAGIGASMCVFRETCGTALIVEHNGSVYSCDHFMYPEYKVGNLNEGNLRSLVFSDQQRQFGEAKATKLPNYCNRCEVRFACHGECPKHRFVLTPDGDPGLNYLCPGLKHFFVHVTPYMNEMVALLKQQQPPALIMDRIKAEDRNRSLIER